MNEKKELKSIAAEQLEEVNGGIGIGSAVYTGRAATTPSSSYFVDVCQSDGAEAKIVGYSYTASNAGRMHHADKE